MPPRTSGALSNGLMSLKFMQRALAPDEKPVKAEAAEIVDDSKWVIERSPEEEAALAASASSSKKFEVTYEASYMPFLFDASNTKDDPNTSNKPIKGRRIFTNGKEVQDAPATNNTTTSSPKPAKDEEEGLHEDDEVDYGESSTDPPPKISDSSSATRNATPAMTPLPSSSRPQFLRPAGVDVPENNRPSRPKPGGPSKRDLFRTMIANARSSEGTPTSGVSTPVIASNEDTVMSLAVGSGARRKAADDGDRPRKKTKKQKAETTMSH